MKIGRKTRHSLTLWTVLCSLPWHTARGAQPQRLTYGDFLSSVGGNGESGAEQAGLQSLEAEVNKVGAFPDPFVQAGREREDVPFANGMTENKMSTPPAWVLSVSQEFPWPGKQESQRNARMASVKVTKAQIDFARTQRKLDAAEYYVEIIRIKQVLSVKKESLRELEQVLVIQNARRRQGLGSHTDLFATQTEIELLKSEINSLENDLLSRGDRAIILAGRSLRTMMEFDSELPRELLVMKKIATVTDHSQLDPLDKIAAAQLERKLASLDAERKESLPALTGSLTLMRDDQKTLMFNAMLGLRIPVFSGSVRGALEEVASRTTAASGKERSWNAQRKDLAILQWERRVNQARANLKTLDERLVPLAAEHTRFLLSDFAQGKSSFVELNQARRTLLKLRETRIGMQVALALEGIRSEKIANGLSDETLDAPMPRLTTSAMEGSSSMPAQNEMGNPSMKSGSRTPRNQSPVKPQNRPSAIQEPEEGSGQSSGGGMGM